MSSFPATIAAASYVTAWRPNFSAYVLIVWW